MRTIKSTIVPVLLCAGFALAGCGGGNDGSTTASTAVATPTTAVSTTATATADSGGKGKGKGKGKHPKATPTTAPATPTPSSTRGIPQTTPTPGPPLQFTIVFTPSAITPNLKSVPAGKPLKVFVENKGPKTINFGLLSNTVPVGVGRIKPGDKTFVEVRNLDPGKLEMGVYKTGGKKPTMSTTVTVTAGG